jgi:hypothetical protein
VSESSLLVSLLVVVVQLGWVTTLCAQTAWVPPRGEGTVSFTYQTYDVAGHFDALGRKTTEGGTYSQTVVTELDYGVTDTVGLSVSLPFIASKYTGHQDFLVGGHPTHAGPLDDGTYHGAFQDIRVEARRLLWIGPLAVAPFIGASFPTHEYETQGEAVPGRHRRDLQLGASAGADLASILPGAYLHARYAYGAAQRLRDIPFTRSNIDVEGGEAVTSRVTLRGLANWQVRHKGPVLDELFDDWEHHDRFIAPSYFNLGGGASFSLTTRADVYAVWVVTISGSNGAHRARTLAVGTTWGFGRGLSGLGGSGGPGAASDRP